MKVRSRLLAICLFVLPVFAGAQNSALPFADEITAFARQDSLRPPTKGGVVFVGSSSIRLWPQLQADFPGSSVTNRGFGGATIPDVARYVQQTILRYKPAQIVFYCGENDLADSDTIQAQTVADRFIALFRTIRKTLPRTAFVFISIKPSPSRAHIQAKVVQTNALIRNFLATQKSTRYVDVYTPMLAEGRPRGELFRADSLHMNEQGYAIWKNRLEKVVLR